MGIHYKVVAVLVACDQFAAARQAICVLQYVVQATLTQDTVGRT